MFTYDTMIYSMVINILATTTLLKELFTTFNSCIVFFSKILSKGEPPKNPYFKAQLLVRTFPISAQKFVALMHNKPELKS